MSEEQTTQTAQTAQAAQAAEGAAGRARPSDGLSLADLRDVVRLRNDLARLEDENRRLRDELDRALPARRDEPQRAAVQEQAPVDAPPPAPLPVDRDPPPPVGPQGPWSRLWRSLAD